MTLRKLLTSDTRSTEIISGVSLLIISILTALTGDKYFPEHLLAAHVWQFWGIISGAFGLLQISAVMLDDTEHIRATTAWITGVYWIWSGTFQIFSGHGQLYDVVLISLGASCMYAFIINLLITNNKNHGMDDFTRSDTE